MANRAGYSADGANESMDDDGFWVIIPTRYDSSRLPGKPLAQIAGKPMVQHVWEQACESGAQRVVVATESNTIADACHDFGAEVVMTASHHANGTSRLAEAVRILDAPSTKRIVNVQGDEPLLPPELIDLVADSLAANPRASISTLAEPITSTTELMRPSVVKLVVNHANEALYFSRAPIPWQRDEWGETGPQKGQSLVAGESSSGRIGALRHVGLYAYRASFLSEYANWPAVSIEQQEQLEQLRALYFGHRIQVAISPREYPAGVDTPEDLERVRRIFVSG
ncbi:3-deoxy-manno-octulosonate cytidylyltransferase [Halomonadaceae bacterium LMG 33818]|uniref:3-deoxy-manno-octulosonate cytidylyltransferase n=1 Tax=Cernens ardua TaxID=3402176 RepID=UPI003EDC87A9